MECAACSRRGNCPLFFRVDVRAVGSSNLFSARVSPVTWTSSEDSPFRILHEDQIRVVPLLLPQSLYDCLVAA